MLNCVAVCFGVLSITICSMSAKFPGVLPCVAVCCSVLLCVAVCGSVLQCVAVCCCVLLCVAVCCSVLQCVAVRVAVFVAVTWSELHSVCCSELQ